MSPRIAVLSVVEAVADDLRSRLFTGNLSGGTALTEAEVSSSYDVSRPTAKAAIEKLVGEGLLERGTHKTARVPVLGAEAVRDLYLTRVYLESEALRQLAARRVAPEAAATANDEIRALGEDARLEIVDPDMRFHTALVNSLGSARMSRIYGSLVDEVRLCMAQVQARNLLSVDVISTEHARILEHIEAGDADAATALLAEHLGRARERLVAAIGGTAGPEALAPELSASLDAR